MELNETIEAMIKTLNYNDRIEFMIQYHDELDDIVNGNEEIAIVLLKALKNRVNKEPRREGVRRESIYHF